MKFRMDKLLFGLSVGLDAVEQEILGVTENHGKRIASLTAAMGRHIGLSKNELIGITACAILHDSALSEHAASMRLGGEECALSMQLHCSKGEKNASFLPFPCDVQGFIQCHHEFNDKSGAFGMNAEETPLGAQFIAIADDLDVRYALQAMPKNDIAELRSVIQRKSGTYYTRAATEAMLGILDSDFLACLSDDRIDVTFHKMMPEWTVSKPAVELMSLSEIVARITDYKSAFTAKHSMQIANRAHWMARSYGFDEETCAKVYIAAAFHDIGKLVTPTAILEKPGKLTSNEFTTIKDHVYWSYNMLKDVEGFDEICRWAVTHHRKLDGKGYPELPDHYLELDFTCRLMACIDIYQAVRETRPYHDGRSHRETMDIMYGMADRGEIDKQITGDIDKEMAQFDIGDGDVPPPLDSGSLDQGYAENTFFS